MQTNGPQDKVISEKSTQINKCPRQEMIGRWSPRKSEPFLCWDKSNMLFSVDFKPGFPRPVNQLLELLN